MEIAVDRSSSPLLLVCLPRLTSPHPPTKASFLPLLFLSLQLDDVIFGTQRPVPLLTIISRWCSLASRINIFFFIARNVSACLLSVAGSDPIPLTYCMHLRVAARMHQAIIEFVFLLEVG